MVAEIVAGIGVAVWLVLLFWRGGFWLSAERDDGAIPYPSAWPSVTVVIPARDEADGIGQAIGSLLRQDYAGDWNIVLVDDASSDGTAEVARRTAWELQAEARLTVFSGRPLPAGWTGKLWALKQGIEVAQAGAKSPDYLLLTDADIVYEPRVLRDLIARAESGRLVLTSLMVKLRCESFAEWCLIPAFIFFFQMLYPFSWVNRADRKTAAAAGGCMLVRALTLRQAGGIDAIRNALIDDCALARIMKARGPIWLGLTERVHSIRRYASFEDIRRMVARSAYAQLRYSLLLLIGTVIGMALIYLAPPLLAGSGSGVAWILGLWAWTLMAVAFQPTLRLYGLSVLWGLALPVIAFSYLLFTFDSAWQFARGQGGMWKGRVQAAAP
jgi:hopene-associated glycosyltransferase HpnB